MTETKPKQIYLLCGQPWGVWRLQTQHFRLNQGTLLSPAFVLSSSFFPSSRLKIIHPMFIMRHIHSFVSPSLFVIKFGISWSSSIYCSLPLHSHCLDGQTIPPLEINQMNYLTLRLQRLIMWLPSSKPQVLCSRILSSLLPNWMMTLR
jgi:hypothetical protein